MCGGVQGCKPKCRISFFLHLSMSGLSQNQNHEGNPDLPLLIDSKQIQIIFPESSGLISVSQAWKHKPPQLKRFDEEEQRLRVLLTLRLQEVVWAQDGPGSCLRRDPPSASRWRSFSSTHHNTERKDKVSEPEGITEAVGHFKWRQIRSENLSSDRTECFMKLSFLIHNRPPSFSSFTLICDWSVVGSGQNFLRT